jgi:hypothetical protein
MESTTCHGKVIAIDVRMSKNKKTKLNLSRETLRSLSEAQMKQPAGGISVRFCDTTGCPTVNVSCGTSCAFPC